MSPNSNTEVPHLQTVLNSGAIPPTSAPTSLLAPMPAYPGAYLPYHAMAGSGPDPGAMFRFDGFHLPGGLAAFCKYMPLIISAFFPNALLLHAFL